MKRNRKNNSLSPENGEVTNFGLNFLLIFTLDELPFRPLYCELGHALYTRCGFQQNVDDAYKKRDSAVSLNDNIPRDALR